MILTDIKVALKNNEEVLLDKMKDVYLKAIIEKELGYYGSS